MKKKYAAFAAGILIMCCGAYFGYINLRFNPDKNLKILYSSQLIKDVYTDKARYSPGEAVKINIEINNKFNKCEKGDLYIYYSHLNNIVAKQEIPFDLKENKATLLSVNWTAPKGDFQGYSVEVYALSGRNVLDNKNTAVDVSYDWSKFPRYGYIADFPKQSIETSAEIIDALNKYHINGLQFYDWQYKHNKPLAGTVDKPQEQWSDIANKLVRWEWRM